MTTHTRQSVRVACEALRQPSTAQVAIGSLTVMRHAWSPVSLGNYDVIVRRGTVVVVAGRFNTIVRHIVAALNQPH